MSTARPHVQILLATRNGAAHLSAQLDSIAAQSHGDWSLLAADDGSHDATPEILSRFAERHPGRVEIRQGPGQGAAANFLTLLAAARADAIVCFCDQDDVWLPHKTARAVERLSRGAHVHSAATFLVDDRLARLGKGSRPPPKGLFFGNALVQNVLAGNTIALSPVAAALLRESVPAALSAGVPYHDWWTYLVVTGAGLDLSYDARPALLYRQHGANAIGTRGRRGAGIARARLMLSGHYGRWIGANLAALTALQDRLTPEARATLRDFAALRIAPGPLRRRRTALRDLGIARQRSVEDRLLRLMLRAGRL